MVKYIWDGRSIFASTSTLLIICTGPLTTASFSGYRFADIFWYDCFYQVSVICCNNTSFPNKIAYQSNQAENLLSTTSNIVDKLAPQYQIKTVKTHDLKGLTGLRILLECENCIQSAPTISWQDCNEMQTTARARKLAKGIADALTDWG